MSDRGGKNVSTVPLCTIGGNGLFEKAITVIGVDEGTARWLFVSVLNTIGARPAELTPDELGNLLPEVDRRLRQLVQEAQADAAMKRLFHLLLEHREPA
jgi:hypothetical protein